MTFIRATHPYGFRSREWARLVAVIPGETRDCDCYLVEFPDGVTDFWAVSDPNDPYEFKEVSDVAGKNWIAKATQDKGGLHKALGVPAGKTIPAKKVAAAATKPGKVGREARLARTLAKLK